MDGSGQSGSECEKSSGEGTGTGVGKRGAGGGTPTNPLSGLARVSTLGSGSSPHFGLEMEVPWFV